MNENPQWKRFEDSRFVVCFSGESPDAQLIETWQGVLDHIDKECGYSGADSCANPNNVPDLHDPDSWMHATSHVLQEGDDTRLKFSQAEFIYCVGITIIRVMEYVTADAMLAARGK